MFLRLKLYAGAALAFLAALVGVWFAGRREGQHRAREDANDDYIDTRERMDDAETSDNSSDAREWLRKRQSDRDM